MRRCLIVMDNNFNDWDLQAVVRSCSFAHAETEEPAPGGGVVRHGASAAARGGALEAAAAVPAPAPKDEAAVQEERRATTAPARAATVTGRASAAGAMAANKEASSGLYGLGYLDLDHKRPFLLPPATTAAASRAGDEVMISFPAASVASASGGVPLPPGRKAGARTPRPKRSKKSQLTKVVREVPVPDGGVSSSDPWAWRKYGQKPIKGSPYPRGYYKCSSMKGCMARKLVERSPAKPGVLKVTYLADHCHPVPTQLNALAGTTRHSKSGSSTAAAAGDEDQQPAASSPKRQEQQQGVSADSSAAPVAVGRGGAEAAAGALQADDESSEFWPAGMDLDELLAPVDDDFDFDAVLDDDDGVLGEPPPESPPALA